MEVDYIANSGSAKKRCDVHMVASTLRAVSGNFDSLFGE